MTLSLHSTITLNNGVQMPVLGLENATVFDFALTSPDMERLDGLNEDLHTIRPPWMTGEWDGS